MRILVGMSGGVDSSYVAMKLIAEGHCVEGALLIMHEYVDVTAAESAAEKIGIPLHVIDCREKFDKIVKSDFVNEYKNGRTPNPCIVCNPKIKFRALCDYAKEHGFDRIATGHYARLTELPSGHHAIAVAEDKRKDQSYMLYRLPEDVLSMLMLPLGESRKSDIRSELSEAGLSELDRKDSQEICFIPEGSYAEYVEAEMGTPEKGEFVDKQGRVLGIHEGIARYTIGQRKGLGISLGTRAFIVDIDPVTNRITLDTEPILSDAFMVRDAVMVEGFSSGEYDVKIRYAAEAVKGSVGWIDGTRAVVQLCRPVKSITPGQSAVFYKDGIVVGGGVIEKV